MSYYQSLTVDAGTAAIATPDNKEYKQFRENGKNTVFTGPNHTEERRDLLVISAGDPVKSGNYRGTRKTSAKFTRDEDVAGVDSTTSLTSPMIFEVNASIPVGLETEDVEPYIKRLIGFLMTDEALDLFLVRRI